MPQVLQEGPSLYVHQPFLLHLLESHPVIVGLVVRLCLAWILPCLLDTHGIAPGIVYTDIDYHIFVDAAKHVRAGHSPYDRHTYRYTPFLAMILAQLPHFESISRYLFCVADVMCGWIIVTFRRDKRRATSAQTTVNTGSYITSSFLHFPPKLLDALLWLHNPLAINICTRGSSESFQVLLPVLLTVTLVTTSPPESSLTTANRNKLWQRALFAGGWHGIAVHSKLYPIIYSLSLITYFAAPFIDHASSATTQFTTKTNRMQPLIRFVITWAQRLSTAAPVLFCISFLATFLGLQHLAYIWYGPISLQEGLLYHFSRIDHRHNYSMHWYWIYLGRAREDFALHMTFIGRLLLVPQLVLLVYTSLVVAPTHLGLALFVQTYLFVAQNKIITAQYLTWYLCLLPLCSDCFGIMTRGLQFSLVLLAITFALWLGSAYCLEMQGWAVHRLLWVSSVAHFWVNMSVIGALLNSYHRRQRELGEVSNETGVAGASKLKAF